MADNMCSFFIYLNILCVIVCAYFKKTVTEGFAAAAPPTVVEGGEREARNIGAATRTNLIGLGRK